MGNVRLILLYLILCRKKKSWHLFRSQSFPKILIEFLVSFLVAAIILLLLGLTALTVKWIFKIEMPTDKVLQGMKLAPNSYVLIVILITGIAIAPLCEELYMVALNSPAQLAAALKSSGDKGIL